MTTAGGSPDRVPAPAAGTLTDRRVLVVEDEPTVAEVACSYLAAGGFQVDHVSDGFAALDRVARSAPDLIVLDRMLPGIDGVEVCRRIRSTSRVPILMLTALGSEEDRILGLEAGADDYLIKPFSPRELVLRVTSILRRSITEFTPQSPLALGRFRLDPNTRAASCDGRTLALTAREFDLLAFFLRHPNQVFSREDLMRAVWGWTHGDLSTVTVHVRRLREKVEVDQGHPQVLTTVWGVGYRFEPFENPGRSAPGRPDPEAANDNRIDPVAETDRPEESTDALV